MSIYAPPSNIQSVFNPSNYGGLGVDGQITTDYLDANYVQFPVVQGNMTLVGTNILGDVTQQGDLTTTGDITGETIEGTSFLVGTTNLLTEIGTKQDTIQDGDLTIAKTDGLQTALENKYDNTGGLISGGVQITGQLAPNGNIFTDERLVIQSGNTMEIQDETEVKISSGVVDIVVDGSDESINLNGYTFLNGSLELAEDESIFLNEVGGGNSKVLNYFNYNKLTDDVEGKQNTIDDGDLTIAKTDGLQTALDNKYDDTGGTIDGDVDISGDLVVGTTNIIDEIGTKQDTITTSTDLSCNSLTTTENIYVGGYLLAPNQVSFRAGRTTSLSTINTSIVLPFDNVIFNIGDAYDNSTYEFTAPVSGIYFFYSKFFTSGNSAYGVDFLLDDGSETDPVLYRLERPSAGEGGTTYLPSSFTTQLNSGDKVYMKRISGTINCPSYPYSQFGGHLLA